MANLPPISPRQTQKPQTQQSSAFDIGRLGRRFVTSLMSEQKRESSDWYKERFQEYQAEVNAWIDLNFPEAIAAEMKNTKEIQEKISRFERITPERQERINQNTEVIKTILQEHGVDDIRSPIAKDLLNRIKEECATILSGSKTIEELGDGTVKTILEKIIIGHNEKQIQELFNNCNVERGEKQNDDLKQQFGNILSGGTAINHSTLNEIFDEIIRPTIFAEMKALLTKVEETNKGDIFPVSPETNTVQKFIDKTNAGSVKQIQENFVNDIASKLRKNIRKQVNNMARNLGLESTSSNPFDNDKISMSELKGKFPSDQRLKSLPDELPNDINELLDLQKKLKGIEKELIQEKAVKDFRSARNKIIQKNNNFEINKGDFIKSSSILDNEAIKSLLDELPNSKSLEEHQTKIKQLNEEIAKFIEKETIEKLKEILPTKPQYILKLKEGLQDTEKRYNELTISAQAWEVTYSPFNVLASAALGDRDYANPKRLTPTDIENIKNEMDSHIKSLQRNIDNTKESNPSLGKEIEESAAKIVGKYEEGVEFVETKTKESAKSFVKAIEKLAYSTGLKAIPIDPAIANAYNLLKEKAAAQEPPITSVQGQKNTYELLSIEDQWKKVSVSKSYENKNETEQRNQFNKFVQRLTNLIDEALPKKQQPESPPASIQPETQPEPIAVDSTRGRTETDSPLPIRLRDNTEKKYNELLTQAKKLGAGEYPTINSLWSEMDNYYIKTIPNRDLRREKLNRNIQISMALIESNIKAAEAAKTKAASATLLDKVADLTNLSTPEKIEIPIPDNLKIKYKTALDEARKAGVLGCTDLETLWTYTLNTLYVTSNLSIEKKTDSFISGILGPTVQWMEDRTAMQKEQQNT